MWSEAFEEVLRGQLVLPADEPLSPDSELSNYGLDSMTTVSLLVELEQRFLVVFPDELLVAETFGTPRTLWAALSGLLSGAC